MSQTLNALGFSHSYHETDGKVGGTRLVGFATDQNGLSAARSTVEFERRALYLALGSTDEQIDRDLYVTMGRELAFICELVPIIKVLFSERLPDPALEILHIDPGLCVGSQLLARIFHSKSSSNLKVNVDAIAATGEYRGAVGALAPDVTFSAGDIRRLTSGRTWDVVIASGGAEDGDGLIERAQMASGLARAHAIVAYSLCKDMHDVAGLSRPFDIRFPVGYRPSFYKLCEMDQATIGDSAIVLLFCKSPSPNDLNDRLRSVGMMQWGSGLPATF